MYSEKKQDIVSQSFYANLAVISFLIGGNAQLRYYCKEHLWVEKLGDLYVLGISKYAVSMLQEISFVNFSQKTNLFKGESLAVFESIKIAWEIQAPFTLTKIKYQSQLENSPALLNDDPEGKGWLCQFQSPDFTSAAWMNEDDYQDFVKTL